MVQEPPIAGPKILPIATIALAFGIFVIDSITDVEVAIPVLYVPVVLLGARFLPAGGVVLVSLGCAALTVIGHFLSPGDHWSSSAVLDPLLGLSALGMTTFLMLKNQSAEAALRERAQLLDLTHDTVFVRDANDVITFWNRGAEELYGWKREDAVGKVSHQLMQTIFPEPLENIMQKLRGTGRWEGRFVHTKRDGTQVTVASRWSMQQDERGRFSGTLETSNDITERQRAEHALRKSEDHLRLVIDTIPAFVWSAQPDGSLDFINQRWTEIGLSLEDLQGSDWTGVIHPDERERVVDKWQLAVTTGKPYENLERVRGADGEYRWFLSRADPLRDERGNVVRWYGTDTDIEDQKRAEEALREQADLLDLTHDTVFVRDANDVITYWNRGAEELYGWKREEAVGKVSHQLTQTVFPEPLEDIMEKLRGTGRWEGPLIHTKRDGTQVTVASRWSLRQDERGRFAGTLETNNDITERQRAEDALRRSEAYLAEAQRLSQTGSFGWRVPHGERSWSDESYRIYGYDRSIKPTLEAILQRVHPEDRALTQQTIERAFQDEKDYDFEHRLLMPDGSVKYLHLVARATRDASGGLEFVGALMDVTAAKRALEELQQTQAELARITRLTTMGQLAASIAHEISQPLTGVVTNGNTCLHWLGDETLDLGKARVAAQRIVRDGERASHVIGRIRALMTKSAPQAIDVDMNGVINEVLALTQTELRRRRVSVRTELAATLPPVLGDRVQLQQVMLNLVVNGIDAMASVTDRPRILQVSSRLETGGDALIFVRDHGTGLDPETADKIFSAFFTTKAKGIGMGLAICRSIVEAHGGSLSASPASPHGAVFQFTLPTKAAGDS